MVERSFGWLNLGVANFRDEKNYRKFRSNASNCLHLYFTQQINQIKFQNILLEIPTADWWTCRFWQNPKLKGEGGFSFSPGVCLSALGNVGIGLASTFWYTLQTEGVAVYSLEGSYAGLEWYVLETDENYLLTVRRTGTESHLAQIALAESEKRFKAIFHSAFQFIALTDPEGVVLEINQTALDIGGVRFEEVIGKPFWETYWWQLSAETVRRLKDSIALAAHGQNLRYEVDVWIKDKTVMIVDFSIKSIIDDEGKVISYFLKDTTLRNKNKLKRH